MIALPGHRPLDVIHRGRRHEVHRLAREADGATVVVKTISAEYVTDRALDDLRHEHRILRDLDVPGVVRTHGLEAVGGSLALVLDDAGPRDLRALLGEGPLAPGPFLDLAVALAGAVRGLHGAGVVHRALDPGHVVLGEEGAVTLVGLRLASTMEGVEPGTPGVQRPEGAPAYMAPEQTGRTGRPVDARSDLYALGAILYELLTGAPPFEADDLGELVHAHLARAPLPPDRLAPGVPAGLSAIVMRLLAKDPAERYQTAASLEADLRKARALWRADGAVPVFPLGREDTDRSFRLPDVLYGLDDVRGTLDRALARAASGSREMVWVTGEPGVGKSSLLLWFGERALAAGARLAAGRFEPRHQGAPYAGLHEVIRALVHQALAGPEPDVAARRAHVAAALGPDAAVLADVFPGLERLVPARAPGRAPDPATTPHRLVDALAAFLRAMAEPGHPLVLCLDDIQWIDPASARLLELLATRAETSHVLVVGAWGGRRVDPGHPLGTVLDAAREAGVRPVPVRLSGLGPGDVARLCADALGCAVDEVGPLAEALHARTRGNPFFVRQLLRSLHREGRLAYDADRGRWVGRLDPGAVPEITDNVVDLMIDAIRRLPPRTRRALELAAYIGPRFSAGMLARLAEAPPAAVAADLWPAVEQGLLVPLDDAWRLPRGGRRSSGPVSLDGAAWRFVHDRVREAASALLPAARRPAVHLAIGRLLAAEISESGPDDRLFDVVEHFERGAALLDDEAERLAVADLNLRAGREARRTGAFATAVARLNAGVAALPPTAARSRPELVSALYRERAECLCLAGRYDDAAGAIEAALARTGDPVERARLFALDVARATVAGDYRAALARGREGLAALGEPLPGPEALPAALAAERAALADALGDRPPESLTFLPAATDPAVQVHLRLLTETAAAAFFLAPALFAFLVHRATRLALDAGNGDHAALAYAGLGITRAALGDDLTTACAFGRLALALIERRGDAALRCKVLHTVGTHLHHWQAPLRESQALLREAHRAGVEGGEVQFAAYAAAARALQLFSMGARLPRVLAEIARALAFAQRYRVRPAVQLLLPARRIVRELMDLPRTAARIDADPERSDRREAPEPSHRLTYCTLGGQAACLQGEADRALALLDEAAEMEAAAAGLVTGPDVHFYRALVIAGSLTDHGPADAGAGLRALAAARARLAPLAERCPDNFLHKLQLVEAELARLEGRPLDAMARYDEAIDAARQQRFTHEQALANELAARFYRGLGRARVAASYLRSARRGYRLWGAATKVRAIDAALRELPAHEPPPALVIAPGDDGDAMDEGAVSLDLRAVLEASRAIASEVDLDRLLVRMLPLVLETAGAERAALLLEQDGRLLVRAVADADGAGPRLVDPVPAADYPRVSMAVVDFVRRTGELLVLGDAGREPLFGGDPRLRARRIRSLLCLPLHEQSALVGLLYLENSLVAHAFTPDRVEVLRLLSGQMAVSLANGRLFERLRREIAEREKAEAALRALNEDLELRVRARTIELEAANAELARSNAELEAFASVASHDLQEPLRMVAGFADLLQRRYGEALDEAGRRYLEHVQGGAERMQALVRGLLDLARAGRDGRPATPVPLRTVLEEVLTDLGPAITEAGATVTSDPLPTIPGDRDQLRQLLQNLVANALKHRGAAPPRVHVSATRTGDGWTLGVVDNGVGVDPDDRDRIFRIFARGRLGDRSGAGMGLAIARRIVERYGGRIWVEPVEGGGAAFYFTWPESPSPAPRRSKAAPAPG